MRTILALRPTLSAGLVAGAAGVGPDDDKARQGEFRNIVQAGGAEAVQPGMLYQHSFWYRASQKVFEDVLKADPECGIAYWGIALSLLWNPHVPPPAKNLAEGAAMIAKGKSVGAKTQRERDYIDALGVMYADYDKVDHRTRIAGLCQGDGAAGAALSERRRGADPLRARAQHLGFAGRQDLRQPAQGRGDPGADREAPAAASRRRALSDPSLRLSADRRERARCGRRYAKIAPGRRPRAAHAVAHLHARRLLEGVDRVEHRSRARREGGQGFPRPAARHGLPGLCLSAARAGREGQGRHRRDDDGDRLHRDVPARTVCAGRLAGALRDRTRRLEGRGRTSGPPQPAAARAGDHAFRPRARRRPLGQSGSRQGRHRQARRAARQAA